MKILNRMVILGMMLASLLISVGSAKAQWLVSYSSEAGYPVSDATGGAGGENSMSHNGTEVDGFVKSTCSGSAVSSSAQYNLGELVTYTWEGNGPTSELSVQFDLIASASFSGTGDGSGLAKSSASTTATSLSISATSFGMNHGSPTPQSGTATFDNGNFTQSFDIYSSSSVGANAATDPGGSYNGTATAQVDFQQQ